MAAARRLAQKDISLVHCMIPLGSCTMKLNAAAEMIPITWETLNRVHPFAPEEQTRGYAELIASLEDILCEITGFPGACNHPPNMVTLRTPHARRRRARRRCVPTT